MNQKKVSQLSSIFPFRLKPNKGLHRGAFGGLAGTIPASCGSLLGLARIAFEAGSYDIIPASGTTFVTRYNMI